MKIDFGTFAFGYSVASGGNTPNWATALGQGKENKINPNPEIVELLKGMVYSSVSLSYISSKIGKGGRVVSGNDSGSPIVLGSVFSKVWINDIQITDTKFIMLVTRDESEHHKGRLRFKYGPSNTYKTQDKTYSNDMFIDQVKEQMHLGDDACWFVYEIRIYNQDELHLCAVIVNEHGKENYHDTAEWHREWEKLIPESGGVTYPGGQEKVGAEEQAVLREGELSPEWFLQKSALYPNYDSDVDEYRSNFLANFSYSELKRLSGRTLLETMFLSNVNKNNLCYRLEYESKGNEYFGSIKSGTAYKYLLFYSDKNESWITGSPKSPKLLSEEDAIVLGTRIRDRLVSGAEYLNNLDNVESETDYRKLESELANVTGGYSSRIWFMKYYAILFPDLFPPIYSMNSQFTVLSKLEIEPEQSTIGRMYQIVDFVKKCNITNVMFNKIFWSNCCNEDNSEERKEENDEMPNCLDYRRQKRNDCIHPLNFIIYGAPGTGKTYSTVEYALAIIENKTIDQFKAENPDRAANVQKYKQYIKESRIVFTTFHQNYGYEEFIQGLRPDPDSDIMSFKKHDGIFKVIADRALSESEEKKYVIIIDEINRANISKVFGELITLIEEDKRWGEVNETSVTLQSGDTFAVPNNLYIIGTMNSADKSISLIDAALRRRFCFIEQKPSSEFVPEGKLRVLFESINDSLEDELKTSDLLIGHSYFINKTEKDLCRILNNSIIPLLYEYLYDNQNKVAKIMKKAIEVSGAGLEFVDEKYGRIKLKEKADQE